MIDSNWNAVAQLTLPAMAIAAATVTIGKTGLFAPLRAAVRRRSERLGRLVGCPYCLSHWFALALVLWDRPGGGVLAGAIAVLALVAQAGAFGLLIVLYLQTLEAEK